MCRSSSSNVFHIPLILNMLHFTLHSKGVWKLWYQNLIETDRLFISKYNYVFLDELIFFKIMWIVPLTSVNAHCLLGVILMEP